MAKVIDYGLDLTAFELQSHYYVNFRVNIPEKGMNRFIYPDMDSLISNLCVK